MPRFVIRDRTTGIVKLDLSSRITKLLGHAYNTRNVAGSVGVPGLGDGTIWASVVPLSTYPRAAVAPITINQTTGVISWPALGYTFIIYYGRY